MTIEMKKVWFDGENVVAQNILESDIYKRHWDIASCKAYAEQLRDKNRSNTAEHAAEAIEYLLALAQPKEQEPVAWEQFYPDIGKPQLEQLPQLSQEVVLQYPKEAVDWQKQQKEYAQQLKVEGPCHVVCQCDKCKAQEQDNAYIYASNLAKTIWQKHYIKESPKFALLDTTEGVLTQIDNMTCGLVREKPAQPEQEPVAWRVWGDNNVPSFTFKKPSDKYVFDPLYTAPSQRKSQFKEFVKWANDAGYDTSHTYDTERSKWLLLSPMATDLWKAWQAAHGIKE